MNGKIFATLSIFIMLLGCASVQVKAPKEPIKIDVSMRLDVYQHVVKDIDAVESAVSGGQTQSMLNSFTGIAYAEEGLPPGTEQAVARRKARYQEIMSAKASSRIAENNMGLLDITDKGRGDAVLSGLVSAENSDRMEIYQAIAKKNGTSVTEVQKVYADKMK